MDDILLWFSEMYNDMLHAAGLSPVDKIEERITIALYHARLYLSESDGDWDNTQSSNENTFNIYCGGGEFRSSL